MKGLGYFLFGVAVGVAAVLAFERAKERHAEADPDTLAESVERKLDRLKVRTLEFAQRN